MLPSESIVLASDADLLPAFDRVSLISFPFAAVMFCPELAGNIIASILLAKVLLTPEVESCELVLSKPGVDGLPVTINVGKNVARMLPAEDASGDGTWTG